MRKAKKPAEAPEDRKRCDNCAHGRFGPGDEMGYCKRFPPTLLMEDGEVNYSFAIVPADEECGEYKRRTQ